MDPTIFFLNLKPQVLFLVAPVIDVLVSRFDATLINPVLDVVVNKWTVHIIVSLRIKATDLRMKEGQVRSG